MYFGWLLNVFKWHTEFPTTSGMASSKQTTLAKRPRMGLGLGLMNNSNKRSSCLCGSLALGWKIGKKIIKDLTPETCTSFLLFFSQLALHFKGDNSRFSDWTRNRTFSFDFSWTLFQQQLKIFAWLKLLLSFTCLYHFWCYFKVTLVSEKLSCT